MGFCASQSLGQLAPFIASLRRTTFAGDICLVIDPATSIFQAGPFTARF
ncbi:MAG TPA: hypothetical protein VKI44_23660 [Acetobacteraceae bacterium]|nr:hypothetical protein [Acetobacteraceae bacterium]